MINLFILFFVLFNVDNYVISSVLPIQPNVVQSGIKSKPTESQVKVSSPWSATKNGSPISTRPQVVTPTRHNFAPAQPIGRSISRPIGRPVGQPIGQPIMPTISSFQPHVQSQSKFQYQPQLPNSRQNFLKLPFLHPKPEKRALNLVRFVSQYRRGIPNAIDLYNSILESHEKRWMLNDPHMMHGHPSRMQASNRRVGKVVHKIVSSFIGDCVGVVISEVFRKLGEVAGELARLVVSETAGHMLSFGHMARSEPKGISKIINAVKAKQS